MRNLPNKYMSGPETNPVSAKRAALEAQVAADKADDGKIKLDEFRNLKRELHDLRNEIDARLARPDAVAAKRTALEEERKALDAISAEIDASADVVDLTPRPLRPLEEAEATEAEEAPETEETDAAERPERRPRPPREGGAEAPKKSIWERVLSRAASIGESFSNGMKKIPDYLPLSLIQSFSKLLSMIGLKDWADMINVYLRPREIRDAMHDKLKVPVNESKTDNKSVEKLNRLYNEKIRNSGGSLTLENYSFEEFYEKRIEEFAKNPPAKDAYILLDLAEFRTASEKKEEEKQNDEDIKKLKAAGATEAADGTWTITGLDLGKIEEKPVTTVSFIKNDGKWKWKSNTEMEYGFEPFQMDIAGLNDAQKAKRTEMNALATALKIERPVVPPEGVDPASETPDGKNKRYVTALVDTFNKVAGEQVVTYEKTDSWRQIGSRFVAALEGEKFQDTLALEMDGGDLEATDTTGSWLSLGISDLDVLIYFEQNILTSPEEAIKTFLQIDPSSLDTTSKNSVTQIQEELKRILKDLPSTPA